MKRDQNRNRRVVSSSTALNPCFAVLNRRDMIWGGTIIFYRYGPSRSNLNQAGMKEENIPSYADDRSSPRVPRIR